MHCFCVIPSTVLEFWSYEFSYTVTKLWVEHLDVVNWRNRLQKVSLDVLILFLHCRKLTNCIWLEEGHRNGEQLLTTEVVLDCKTQSSSLVFIHWYNTYWDQSKTQFYQICSMRAATYEIISTCISLTHFTIDSLYTKSACHHSKCTLNFWAIPGHVRSIQGSERCL